MGISYYWKDALGRQLIKSIGINLLTEKETIDSLKEHQILEMAGATIALQEVKDSIDSTKTIFTEVKRTLQNIRVYKYTTNDERATLRPCGALLANKMVYNTDFSRVDIIKDFLYLRKRERIQRNILIAPWHHYFGKAFTGYYDYIFYVAAKICRIKDALSADEFDSSVVSYALANTAYEQEFLQLMGFTENRIFDSRTTSIEFNKCILANNQDYTYPDITDILSLKKYINAHVNVEGGGNNRIYISRACRRKITNECELIKMLERFNFKIIEDKPRTIAEQIALFKNASFIIGPHGAAFTNLIWCEEGTHVFELFSPNFASIHFRYLSKLMNLRYSAYSKGDLIRCDSRAVNEDITVSVSDIEMYLNEVLAP